MTKYIKDAHGKFAGSIGEGRDVIPTVASHLRDLANDAEAGTCTSQDIGTALRYLVSHYPELHEQVTVTRYGKDLTMTTAQQDATRGFEVVDFSMTKDGDLVIVTPDEWADSPRDNDQPNISLFIGSSKYLPTETQLPNTSSFEEDIVATYGENTMLVPIYVYDHSGVSYSAGTAIRVGERVPSGAEHGDRWDTSMAGFAVITEDTVRSTYGHTGEDAWMQAIECTESEVEIFSQWSNEGGYKALVIAPDGEVVDSCCGFYSVHEALQAGI